MAAEKLPEDFNWVKERAECSLSVVFKKLEFGVNEDVQAITEIVRRFPEAPKYSIVGGNRQFSVIREDPATAASPIGSTRDVSFSIQGNEIVVARDNEPVLRATITLNNEGKCKLKVGEEELEHWHVRRQALEDLFFWSPENKPKLARKGFTA